MLGVTIGSLIFAALVAAGAFAFASWVVKKGDGLHEDLRQTAIAETANKVQVAALQEKIAAAAAALADERKRHAEEARLNEERIAALRARLATVDTEEGINASLSRGAT